MSDQESGAPSQPISVYTVLMVMTEQMALFAWQKLGLHPDPATGKLERNLTEAKVAIDVVGDLIAKLEPQLDDDDRRQLHNLIRDLRVNFVEKSKESNV